MLMVVRQSEMKVAQKTERHRPSTAANPAPGGIILNQIVPGNHLE